MGGGDITCTVRPAEHALTPVRYGAEQSVLCLASVAEINMLLAPDRAAGGRQAVACLTARVRDRWRGLEGLGASHHRCEGSAGFPHRHAELAGREP
jgi:hypothetical protein